MGIHTRTILTMSREGSRIVSYNLNTKELKVLIGDFATAFDPCTYWDVGRSLRLPVPQEGWWMPDMEINVDGSGLRQMTDYKGTCQVRFIMRLAVLKKERAV